MAKTKQVKPKNRYYSSENIKKTGAAIKVVYGKRSHGKTFDRIVDAVTDYWDGRNNKELRQTAYVRRRKENLAARYMKKVGDTIVLDETGRNRVKEITGGVYDTIVYWNYEWRLGKTKEDGSVIKDDNPFMIAFDLSTWYNGKGGGYPFVFHIWLEEFCKTRQETYIDGEFGAFQQVLSTIARNRQNVDVWLTGNTLDPFCPYFEEMGLTNVLNQKPGTIEIYKLGKTDETIAVERTNDDSDYKDSTTVPKFRFTFDTQDSDMINNGDWQFGIFPLFDNREVNEDRIKQSEIIGRFFIEFKKNIVQCDVVSRETEAFIYAHKDLDTLHPLDYNRDLIYSLDWNTKHNYRRRLDRSFSDGEDIIVMLMRMEKIFYDSNLTGFTVDSYMKESVRRA